MVVVAEYTGVVKALTVKEPTAPTTMKRAVIHHQRRINCQRVLSFIYYLTLPRFEGSGIRGRGSAVSSSTLDPEPAIRLNRETSISNIHAIFASTIASARPSAPQFLTMGTPSTIYRTTVAAPARRGRAVSRRA